ncbi:hypothetical protein BDV18DRAFT_165945 [Aspergillus unguis]
MHFPGVAVVIGAGSGIGRATAKLFAEQACQRIALGDVDLAATQQTKEQILEINRNAEVLVVQSDVTEEQSVRHFVRSTVSSFGRIDYACNVAGVLIPGSSTIFSSGEFDRQFAVNNRGTWLCQKYQLEQMLTQEPLTAPGSTHAARGGIVNVSSMAAIRTYDNLPAYCASKAAILGFTKADALQYARDLIRINAVCPGVIATPMLGNIDDDGSTNIADMTREMAMGRQGQPEEIAECLVWLASGRASFVTATHLTANGGMSPEASKVRG